MTATETARMTFRDTLAAALEQKGWSRGELAKQSGVPYATVKSWFQAHKDKDENPTGRLPSIKHLAAVARAIGVSLDHFKDCDEFQ